MKHQALVPDDLWEAIEPFLPNESPKPKGGRPRVPDRAALAGIVFVLRTGIAWQMLPTELGCGSGSTCWRRLRDWQAAGVWANLHEPLLNWLGDQAAIDWRRASVDSLSVRAKRGASRRGRTRPTAASPARSTTWSSTGRASRSPSGARTPIPTTRPGCCPRSTRSRPSSVHEGSRDGRAGVRPSCTATRATITRPCVPVASPRGLPGGGSSRASGSAGIAGSLSVRWPGCSATAASLCATSDGPTCSRACSTWSARWSASASSSRRPPDEHGGTRSVPPEANAERGHSDLPVPLANA